MNRIPMVNRIPCLEFPRKDAIIDSYQCTRGKSIVCASSEINHEMDGEQRRQAYWKGSQYGPPVAYFNLVQLTSARVDDSK